MSALHKQLQGVKEELTRMAGLVEQAIHGASQALGGRDVDLARAVIRGDRQVDLIQNEVENRCLTLMATQQPVAVDLRFLYASMLICGYLERMGDQAKNVARRVLALAKLPPDQTPAQLLIMAEVAKEMARDCLDAIARDDVKLAQQVVERDDEMDDLDGQFLEDMIQWMTDERRVVRRGVEYILAARALERIGDEATNIAEQVVFLVDGRVVRHIEHTEGGQTPC
jgi:phosphate transport system protein